MRSDSRDTVTNKWWVGSSSLYESIRLQPCGIKRDKRVRKISSLVGTVFFILVCSGCARQQNLPELDLAIQPVDINESYLREPSQPEGEPTDPENETKILEDTRSGQDSTTVKGALAPISWPSRKSSMAFSPKGIFDEEESLSLVADNMPLADFIHYVFGDLLGINYIFGDAIVSGDAGGDHVTLSLTNALAPKQIFKLASDLLAERKIHVRYGSGTFYIYRESSSQPGPKLVVGVGNRSAEVPETSRRILQVIPLEFGVKMNIDQSLKSVLRANKIYSDHSNSAVYVEGSRDEILQALDIISILDTPAMRGRHIGLIALNFMSAIEFAEEVKLLLENEGVESSLNTPKQKNIVLVPLTNLDAVAVFAVSKRLFDRVRYWATIIDVPAEGSTERYFLYHPKYSRAIDLGESIGALLGDGAVGGRTGSTNDDTNNTTGNAPSADRVSGFGNDRMRMVVDKRANALIFFTTGSEYKALLPMLNELDTLPRQVMLDVTIAEVTLKDEFKYGVEWALQRGETRLVTQGAFGVSEIGGIGLLIDGAEGPMQANFIKQNSLVNVLSNPSLLVRDGITASIEVGSDISVVGQTTQDPINGERQTTAAEYRQTGVNLSVTPTINARGIVVLEISQTISNSVPSSTGAGGNPDIFERSLETEVVAKSGQTVLLAGLISESSSKGGSGAPGLKDIPLLGALFKSDSQSAIRTELIMLITPRIIDTDDRWDDVYKEFRSKLNFFSQPE